MQINLHFFIVEITASRSKWTRSAIKREVLRVKREAGSISAIKRYRELVSPPPTLVAAKLFVDCLPPA